MKVEFTTYPIKEWVLDKDSGLLGDNVQSVDAIAQDVKFALSTERNMYPIMGSNFGVTFGDLVGRDSSYVKAQVKRRIQDALSIDDRIISISEFKFTKPDSDTLSISFIVSSVLGDFEMTTEIVGS